MNKKTIIIIVALIALVGIGFWVLSGGAVGKQLKSFSVEAPDFGQPNFLVSSEKVARVEVWALPESARSDNAAVKLGTMEIAESDKNGNQTWIMPVPTEKASYKNVYVVGYLENSRKTNRLSLSYKTPAEISAALWPAPKQAVLFGTVNRLKSTTFVLAITNPTSVVTITSMPKTVVTDAAGKKVAFSRIKNYINVSVTGHYVDESTFEATQIEIAK